MNMVELKKKARKVGVVPARLRKIELVRAIQIAEGFKPCFANSNGGCQYDNCCFKEDCIEQHAAVMA